MPSTVQVIPVELPGRGTRVKEPPFVRLSSLIEELAEAIQPLLDAPFAFFGHSMGALIAFELTRHLERKYGVDPQILFVSGRRAPQIPDASPVTYNLPREELIKELYRFEGTPKEVLDNAELMEFMLPVIRADFQLIETYEYLDGMPIRCPIIAFGGLQDYEENRYLIVQWKHQTTSRFRLHLLPGNHFFIRSSEAPLLKLLARELQELIFSSQLSNTSS